MNWRAADAHFQRTTAGVRNHTTATDADADVDYEVVRGALPDGLSGYGYFTAWDRGSASGLRAREPHFLSSPGRLAQIRMARGRVSVRLRTLQNAAWHLRSIAPGSFLRNSVAELSAFGPSNLSNVAPLPYARAGGGFRMLLGCDPAVPSEVHPLTLRYLGPLAGRWPAFLKGALTSMTMTTGHPAWDPEDERLYVACLRPRPSLRPSRPVGADVRLAVHDSERQLGVVPLTLDGRRLHIAQASIHQVVTTRRYVLLAETPIAFGLATLLKPLLGRWLKPPLPRPETRVFIVSKADIERALADGGAAPCRESRWAWEASHLMADRDDSDDRITLFAPLSIGFDVTRSLQPGDTLLSGEPLPDGVDTIFGAATDLQVCARYVLDAAGGPPLDERRFPPRDPDDPAFPLGIMLQINTLPLAYRRSGGPHDLLSVSERWSHTYWCSTGWLPVMETREVFEAWRGRSERYIPEDAFLAASQRPENTACLYRLDRELELELGRDVYRWPAGTLAATPLFVPREGGRDMTEGWLVTLVTGPEAGAHNEVWIFDAGRPLAEGPCCVLAPTRAAPFRVGYPLHAIWMDTDAVEHAEPPPPSSMVSVPWWLRAGNLASLALSAARSLLPWG